jgi:hypothetical protein
VNDDIEHNYVLAEEFEKERTLTRIRTGALARKRAESDASSASTASKSSKRVVPLTSEAPELEENFRSVSDSSIDFMNTSDNVELEFGSTEVNDVRIDLFESIPDPYPHSEDFQRVIITGTKDPVDHDTSHACTSLKVTALSFNIRIFH